MGVVSGFFKIVKLPSLIQDAIKNANDKKQQKEADKVDKKFQRDTQNLDQDNDKSELGDVEDLGSELEQIIEDAMSEHEAISAEMQESINTLRGFAPERIDYPNDTPDLVKQFTNANGGNMDAATAALRNTGYLMQGQQQIGQTVQLTGQAVASMAQNMDQSIQTTMDFMEEVPETIRDAAENSHAELEEFLKKWRKGQDRQFAFLNALKSVATWPLRAGKFTISRTEAAMIRAKVIQQTLAEILGKSAAFKVILNELAKKFPFIAKLQKGFYSIVNFIPNITTYLNENFNAIKAQVGRIVFQVVGAMGHALGSTPTLGALWTTATTGRCDAKDTVYSTWGEGWLKDTVDDWRVIHGASGKDISEQRKFLNTAKKNFQKSITDDTRKQYEQILGRELTDNEWEKIKEGDVENLISEKRSSLLKNDKNYQTYKSLQDQTSMWSDEFKDITINGKKINIPERWRENIYRILKDFSNAQMGDPQKFTEQKNKALTGLAGIGFESTSNAREKEFQNKGLPEIQNLIYTTDKTSNLSDESVANLFSSDLGYLVRKQGGMQQRIAAAMTDPDMVEALQSRGYKYDKEGNLIHIDEEQRRSFSEIDDESIQKSIQGTEALKGILGAPDNRGSRREEFINQMIRKYHLDYQSVKKEFEKHPDCTKDPSKGGNIMFWEETVTKGKTTHTYFGIRKKWFDAWCKAHPEVGFKESQNDYIDISVDVGGSHVETRNQGTNAYREFDENGNGVDVDKIKPQNTMMPQGEIQDDSNAGGVAPVKVEVTQAPKIETPKEEAMGSVNNQLPPEIEILDAKPSISNDVIDPVTGTMLRKAASDYYAQKQREQTEALRRQEKAREEALLEEAAQMTGMSVETIRANYNRLHKKHGVTLDEYIQTIKNINNLQEEVITKGTQKAAELDKKQTQLTNEIEEFTQAHSSVKDAGSSGIKSSWDNIKTILTDVDQQHRDIVWDPDFEVNDPSVKGGKRKGAFVKVSKRSAEKILINAEFEKPEIKSAILKAKANQAWERGEAYTPQDNKNLEEHDKETNRQIAKLLRQQEQTNNSLQAIAALIKATESTPSIVYNNVTQEGNNSQKDTAQLLDINLDQYVR